MKSRQLTFNEYEKSTDNTAIYAQNISKMVDKIASGHATQEQIDECKHLLCMSYVTLGLCGEAGEVANKMKKRLRGGSLSHDDRLPFALRDELGDVGWYLARACSEIGFPFVTVMGNNISKLEDRKERGVIEGDGDTR